MAEVDVYKKVIHSFSQDSLPQLNQPKTELCSEGKKGPLPHMGGMDRDKILIQKKKNIFVLSYDAAHRLTMDPDKTQRVQVQAC